MKTLKNITLTFILVAFFGCSKDNDVEIESTFADLKGIWEVTHYSYEGTTSYNSISSNENWNTSYHAEAWLLDFNIEFSEEPNNYSVLGTYNIDYYYTDEHGDEYYYVGEQTKDEDGSYVRNSMSNISFTINNDVKHGTILELNDTTLRINVSSSSSETNAENVVITNIRNETYIYSRIN